MVILMLSFSIVRHPVYSSGVQEDGIGVVSISTRYDPLSGSFHVFGEVQNNLEVTAGSIMLNATFYGFDNEIIATILGPPYIDFLNSGEKSAFEISAYGNEATTISNFSHYVVSATWEETQAKPAYLKLKVDNVSSDSCGSYHITGTITNHGGNYTNDITVSSVFYNSKEQVEAAASTKLADNQKGLAPAVSAPFVFIIEKNMLPHFAFYSLNAQSDFYSLSETENVDDVTFGGDSPRIMVSSDSNSYAVGVNKIKISGTVSEVSPADFKDPKNKPLVAIRIMTPTSISLNVATTLLSANGTFSKDIDFLAPTGSEGNVYRIIANYKGLTAENSFRISFDNDSSNDCNDKTGVSLQQFGLSSGDISSLPNGTLYSTEDDEMNIGDTLDISSGVKNEVSKPQPIFTIYEVDDSEGVVVFLHIDSAVLDSGPDVQYRSSVPWTPNAPGTFTIKTLFLSSLEHPIVLSPIIVRPMTVNQVVES